MLAALGVLVLVLVPAAVLYPVFTGVLAPGLAAYSIRAPVWRYQVPVGTLVVYRTSTTRTYKF